MNTKPRGRQFFFNPGPTHIPERVLAAMHRPTIDFLTEDFKTALRDTHSALKRTLRTRQHLLLHMANGHGAWEAALCNVFEEGDTVLMLESGYFSFHWTKMARDLGLNVDTMHADWRQGVPPEALAERLAADRGRQIKGVLIVHNETATGHVQPLADVRAAMDQTGHPAMLLVDTISSFASMDFHFDDWNVDVAVGSSQKGLMMVTGLSFTCISERAMDASRRGGMKRSYYDWQQMLTVEPQRFPGTSPVHLVYGLNEALKMLEEEGLESVIARHARLAEATRAAVRHWGGQPEPSAITVTDDGLSAPVKQIELLIREPGRRSNSVTAILVPEGCDSNHMRRIALDRFNLSLGQGLGPLAGKAFRIGHLGDLNEPMLLGALATVELALRASGTPHESGGVEAAIAALSDA
ncbi:MAG: pyridoxal-phosphate-dependent aminotransferase family protein [Hyphomicrobiaceae bacterium]